MNMFKNLLSLMILLMFLNLAFAQEVGVNWNFENGNDHGFNLHSLVPAVAAPDSPNVAGDEALTGGWNDTLTTNLPQAGVAWTACTA